MRENKIKLKDCDVTILYREYKRNRYYISVACTTKKGRIITILSKGDIYLRDSMNKEK